MQVVEHEVALELTRIVASLRETHSDYHVLHFQLSNLSPAYKTPYQIRIAVAQASSLLRDKSGHILCFDDGDIMIFCHQCSYALIEATIFTIRYLFAHDPLSYTSEGFENDALCLVYHLDYQWSLFYTAYQKKKYRITQGNVEGASGNLNAQHLADVIQKLQTIDSTSLIKYQTICAVPDRSNMVAAELFSEYFVNHNALNTALATNLNLQSSACLHKYLTEQLDVMVLRFLGNQMKQQRSQSTAVSLNINTQTLLTEDFTTFDHSLSPRQKASTLFEIQAADFFENIPRFMAAKNSIKPLGYRFCLDGIALSNLAYIETIRHEFDLIKLHWHPSIAQDATKKDIQAWKLLVEQYNPNRIILCHCDSHEAVEFGRELGIHLYQGYHIDRLIYASSLAMEST